MTKRGNKSGQSWVEIGNMGFNHTNFQNNYIRTTKYTALTFIPLALFYQFKRYANIYFLLVAILQSIPAISPLSPISSWAPLIFVISLSIIREAFEDLARYKSDLETNSAKTERYENGMWYTIEWKDVFVGDIVRTKDGEFFPADIILLESSDPKGMAYIMTSSLDGEKNLKPKFALNDTQKKRTSNSHFLVEGRINFGPPDENLYSFSGSLEMDGKNYGLSAKQLLIRGANLKNIDYVIGAVVYTGKNTKIVLNSGEASYKQSQIDVITNRLIIALLCLQVLLCIAGAIGSLVWNIYYSQTYSEFIPVRFNSFLESVTTFFTLFILLTGMIPISLIISLDMVKLTQAYFVNKDLDMYNAADNRHSHAYSSSLMEELGQIEYIFSDKTGTLTSNVLEFKYAFIGDSFFGDSSFMEEPTTIKKKSSKGELHDGIAYTFDDKRLASSNSTLINKNEKFVFFDENLRELYRIKSLQGLADHFLLILAICHDCICEFDKENNNEISYSGMSPDEVSLVDAAKHLGYVFRGVTNSGKLLEINNEEVEIEVLQFFEFDSARKRSSIIIKHDGVIKHLMKGADSIIIERLSKTQTQPYLGQTKQLLEKFSLKGLRTLCYAMKVISIQEYMQIEATLKGFDTSTEKLKLVNDYADKIETGFYLLGCTAVEDKLQEKVPQTIADCIKADIKVWMLTGDKLETAENIAFSCQLIQDSFKKVYIRESDDLHIKLSDIQSQLNARRQDEKVSLIVEGPVIMKIVADKELAAEYVEHVFTKSDSVVCCRMSPNGKGDVVSLVKTYKERITLAIGDGANDVNMIQRAHIGVGLYGKEGMRAVQASDFALVDFKSLWKLLFVHGHWSYIRIAEMIQYFYYKNIAFALPQFFYTCYNVFSGQTLYDDYYITFYNLIFTSWPVLIRAIFDQDIYYKKWTKNDNEGMHRKKTLYENKVLKKFYPYLYYVGQRNVIFTLFNQI